MAMVHAFLDHSAPRPEVLKHLSNAVIALFTVLKHPSSAVIAFYEGREWDTISARGYVAGYFIHYAIIVPPYTMYGGTIFTREFGMGIQYFRDTGFTTTPVFSVSST